MRKSVAAALVLALSIIPAGAATAHQPVFLLPTDTTPNAGPLLVDGTVSFAIRASFTKSGQKQAFRAALKEGDSLEIQYLIVDKKPENTLKNTMLPQLVVTSPTGKKLTMKFNERTKFYEPYGRTNYLYLARYSAPAETGIYQFVATSRARAAITIAVGDREVQGEVLRGPAPSPAAAQPSPATAQPTPAAVAPAATPTPSPTPTAEVTTQAGYTMAKVKENNSSASCWSVINGNVYNLTQWINSHPGGQSVIRGLCGVDGTSSFNGKHRGDGGPASILTGYLLGPLAK
jgi:cytochrome b involved in lipid metabolism